jgi:hypothetical protein
MTLIQGLDRLRIGASRQILVRRCGTTHLWTIIQAPGKSNAPLHRPGGPEQDQSHTFTYLTTATVRVTGTTTSLQ